MKDAFKEHPFWFLITAAILVEGVVNVVQFALQCH